MSPSTFVTLYRRLFLPQSVVVERDSGHRVGSALDELVVEGEGVDVGEAPVVLALQRLQRRQVVERLCRRGVASLAGLTKIS